MNSVEISDKKKATQAICSAWLSSGIGLGLVDNISYDKLCDNFVVFQVLGSLPMGYFIDTLRSTAQQLGNLLVDLPTG